MTDKVLALLNDKFIPVAPGWGSTIRRDSKEYEWWTEVTRVAKKINGVSIDDATIPGTMFWVATAAGQRVSIRSRCTRPGPGNRVLAANLGVALQAYAHLPESERRPAQPIKDADQPKVAPPPGGLILISFDRPFRRDAAGKYHDQTGHSAPGEGSLRNHVPWQPGAQRDAFWVTRDECLSLMPKNPRQGETFSVPPRLIKRIGLFALTVRSAWQELYRWTPDSIRKADLKLTVESVSPTAVQMRLHGDFLLTSKKAGPFPGMLKGTSMSDVPDDRYDAHVEGQLVYDPAKKRFTRWDMVALGDYVGFTLTNEWHGPNRQGFRVAYDPVPIAMSFEIDRYNYEMPPEYRRTIPYMLWYFRDRKDMDFDYYYNPDKWEANWKKRQKK